MRYLLSFLLALALAFSAWGADNDIAVMPGGQYVLRNVATGSYLVKDGTTTHDERAASNWRVVTNDTIRYDNPEQHYYIHSDETILQLNNSGGGWSVKFSPLDEIRLWCRTDSVKDEDGIVSGNNFYPSKPQTLTAVFLPDIQTGVSAHRQNVDKDNFSDNQSFDLAGRRIITPRGGQIIIRNRQKVVVK